jgi:uncharacterized membrane protein
MSAGTDDDGDERAAFCFFAGVFFAGVFFAGVFFAGVFFAGVFFAVVFFLTVFFTGGTLRLRRSRRAGDERGDLDAALSRRCR